MAIDYPASSTTPAEEELHMADMNSSHILTFPDKKAMLEITPGKHTLPSTSKHIPSNTKSGEIHPASDSGDSKR